VYVLVVTVGDRAASSGLMVHSVGFLSSDEEILDQGEVIDTEWLIFFN